jgi:hypothetical protein
VHLGSTAMGGVLDLFIGPVRTGSLSIAPPFQCMLVKTHLERPKDDMFSMMICLQTTMHFEAKDCTEIELRSATAEGRERIGSLKG